MATIPILATGQSNMWGKGTGGDSWAPVRANVRAWNNPSIAVPGTGWSGIVRSHAPFRIPPGEETGANCLAAVFCNRLGADRPDDEVRLVLAAKPGQDVLQWSDVDSGVCFQSVVDRYTESGLAPAQILLWQQGEADCLAGTPVGTYKSRFYAWTQSAKQAGILAYNALLLVGGIAEIKTGWAAFNQNAIAALSGTHYVAPPNAYVMADDVHFTGPGLDVFGDRYIAAYQAT